MPSFEVKINLKQRCQQIMVEKCAAKLSKQVISKRKDNEKQDSANGKKKNTLAKHHVVTKMADKKTKPNETKQNNDMKVEEEKRKLYFEQDISKVEHQSSSLKMEDKGNAELDKKISMPKEDTEQVSTLIIEDRGNVKVENEEQNVPKVEENQDKSLLSTSTAKTNSTIGIPEVEELPKVHADQVKVENKAPKHKEQNVPKMKKNQDKSLLSKSTAKTNSTIDMLKVKKLPKEEGDQVIVENEAPKHIEENVPKTDDDIQNATASNIQPDNRKPFARLLDQWKNKEEGYATVPTKRDACFVATKRRDTSQPSSSKIDDKKEKPTLKQTQTQAASNIPQSVHQDKPMWKECGSHVEQITYNDYTSVQSIVEKENQAHMLSDLGVSASLEYKDCFKILCDQYIMKSRQVKLSKKYAQMHEFYTIKHLKSHDFGKDYLIVKSIDRSKFEQERVHVEVKGKKNLYVFKMITYPGVNDRQALLFSRLKSTLHKLLDFSNSLFHPNICQFFGAYSTNFFCAFIHEYLPCGDMWDIISDRTCFQVNRELYRKRMLFYSSQLLLALEYLHKHKIYHMHLNQDSFCLDYKGYAKLVNFEHAVSGNDRTIEQDSEMLNFIAVCRLECKQGINGIDIEEYKRQLMERCNNGFIYEIDIFGVSMFFLNFVEEFNSLENEHKSSYSHLLEYDLCSRCAGLYADDDGIAVPKARDIISDHPYYKDIDFAKLLLRGYDLKEELKLELLAERFDKCTQKENEPVESDLIFDEDQAFLQEINDLACLQIVMPDYYKIFADLSVER